MCRVFALVANEQRDIIFISRILNVLNQFGESIIIPEKDILAQEKKVNLVLIDDNDVTDTAKLVYELRHEKPCLPIIVFLLDHDLDQARSVFKMGATDCLVKGLDEDLFISRLKNEYLKHVR